MENKVKKIKGLNVVVRENTMDEYVIKESEYDKCEFTKNDIWLDAGANIGAFALKYHDKVKQIISYEPDVENYKNLKQNLELNNIYNCKTFKLCLVENNDKTRKFYLNKKTNKGIHSLIIKKGRDEVMVNCANINSVVKKFNINKIKMDIEGAEYELIKSMDFTNIKEFIFEYHFKHLKDFSKEKFYQTIDILKNNFTTIKHREPNGSWQIIIHAKK
jgi:FkbM family methyltransferase